jgi:hypothetical protein
MIVLPNHLFMGKTLKKTWLISRLMGANGHRRFARITSPISVGSHDPGPTSAKEYATRRQSSTPDSIERVIAKLLRMREGGPAFILSRRIYAKVFYVIIMLCLRSRNIKRAFGKKSAKAAGFAPEPETGEMIFLVGRAMMFAMIDRKTSLFTGVHEKRLAGSFALSNRNRSISDFLTRSDFVDGSEANRAESSR